MTRDRPLTLSITETLDPLRHHGAIHAPSHLSTDEFPRAAQGRYRARRKTTASVRRPILPYRFLLLSANPSSEAEDVESVDCKVEDSGYNIPASPTWSSQGSPTSAVENPFGSNTLYPLPQNQTNGGSNAYGRSPPSDRWQGESLLSPVQRHDMSWVSGSTLSSSHTMSRRREPSLMQSDQWPPAQSQSSRWQGGSQESGSSPTINSGGMYQDRSRVRAAHQYEGNNTVHRRESDGLQHNYSVRYTPHPTATREGALQRLHWHARDTPDASRDLRRSSTSAHGFTSSPTIPFAAQGYHTPTYTSTWTSPDANLLNTPTLHPISSQANMSYDGAYAGSSNSIVSSPDDYANVEEYHES